MNIIKLLDSFNIDDRSSEEKDIFMSRKEAFGKLGNYAKKMSLTALPLGILSAMPKIAFAQENATPAEVLNYALTLEYLEFNFYNHSLAGDDTDLGLTDEETAAITLIRDHEQAHVDFLTDVIANTLGETPVQYEYSDFDFRAGGLFDTVYTSKPVFLAVAQAFEDTGVRAYKGQAGNVMGNDVLLTAALQIHSVEARHAAHIRRMRIASGTAVNANEKEWVTNPDYDGLDLGGAATSDQQAGTKPVYAGEDNIMHLGVDATSVTDIEAMAVMEGYDEPLSMQDVLAIATPFAPFLAG